MQYSPYYTSRKTNFAMYQTSGVMTSTIRKQCHTPSACVVLQFLVYCCDVRVKIKEPGACVKHAHNSHFLRSGSQHVNKNDY